MPWHVGEQGSHGCDGYPVVKDGTDEVEGCHPTREGANRQMAALYANEPEVRSVGEVEHRSSTLQDVNTRQRIVEIIAVPYDEETDVLWRGEVWHESFDRKAFDGIESHVGRVQVNREHVKGDTVGKVIAADPGHKDGLFARVKIYNTPRGDETLTLAGEGGTFPSIGWRLNRPSDHRTERRSMTRRVLRAFWDHQAFVEDPAYVGAGVLAVRAGQSGLVVAEKPLPPTPALDEALADPLFAEIAARFRQ